MEITTDTKVGEIVRRNFSTARMFEANHIDFCCGGNVSLTEAAEKEGINVSKLMGELSSALQKEDRDANFIESLSLTGLCDYIMQTHHTYLNEAIPFLQQKLQKLCDVHGDHHPELFEVHGLFADAGEKLTSHMQQEEMILFPHIRQLEKYSLEGSDRPVNMGLAASSINQMEAEHQVEGDRFMKLSEITNNYTVPPDGCNTFELTYKTLKEFEDDLHRHIHLENNVLFPKSIHLENLLE